MSETLIKIFHYQLYPRRFGGAARMELVVGQHAQKEIER
jgi:hypothetical protein